MYLRIKLLFAKCGLKNNEIKILILFTLLAYPFINGYFVPVVLRVCTL